MAKEIVNWVKMRKIVKIHVIPMSLPVIMENALTNAMSVTAYATAKMVQMNSIVLPGGVMTMSLCAMMDPAHTEAISVIIGMTVLTVVTSMIAVNGALSMSFRVTMEHVSTSIANVTEQTIAPMEATRETVIITILRHSVAHNMSALMGPVLSMLSDVTVVEIAEMDRTSKIVHVGPTNSHVTMDSAYQNICSATGNRIVEINPTNETVPAQGLSSDVTPVSAYRSLGGVIFGLTVPTVLTSTAANPNVGIMSLPVATAAASTTDKNVIDVMIVQTAAMN